MDSKTFKAVSFAIAWLNATGFKTYDYFLSTLTRLIKSLYNGDIGGEFNDILSNLISGQLKQATQQAWDDEGTDMDFPDYLTSAADEMITNQQGYIDGLYKDIIDAKVDGTPIDPLLSRTDLWVNRWTEMYNEAVHLITLQNGGKEEWVLGETESHCDTCEALNGIVAYASEWDSLDVKPQGAPNSLLTCGGWKCDCKRHPTDQRRSPKAYDTILNIVQKG